MEVVSSWKEEVEDKIQRKPCGKATQYTTCTDNTLGVTMLLMLVLGSRLLHNTGMRGLTER